MDSYLRKDVIFSDKRNLKLFSRREYVRKWPVTRYDAKYTTKTVKFDGQSLVTWEAIKKTSPKSSYDVRIGWIQWANIQVTQNISVVRQFFFDGKMIQFCDESAMKHKPGYAAFFVIPTNRVAPSYSASWFYGLNIGITILLDWISWISALIQQQFAMGLT